MASDLLAGESQDVGEFLPPAHFVQQRLVARVLTRVAVQPAALRHRVDLCPHVVWNSGRTRSSLQQEHAGQLITEEYFLFLQLINDFTFQTTDAPEY